MHLAHTSVLSDRLESPRQVSTRPMYRPVVVGCAPALGLGRFGGSCYSMEPLAEARGLEDLDPPTIFSHNVFE